MVMPNPVGTDRRRRDDDDAHKRKVETAKQRLAQAERDFTAALDKLNSDYLALLEKGGTLYASAIERGQRVYNAIEQPARARYERELAIADNAYQGIVDPAGKELDRLSAAAQDMFKRAIRPIEDAYNTILNEYGALTQGTTLGTAAL